MPKKIYMFTETADLANFSYRGVYVSLTIDTRKWVVTERDKKGNPVAHDMSQPLPIVLRVTKDGKRQYLSIGEKMPIGKWGELCEHEKNKRIKTDAQKRNELKKHLNDLKPMVMEMVDDESFTLNRIKNRYKGLSDTTVTIYSIWDSIIASKKEEDKAGTARCNTDVRNRFERDLGKNIELSDIDRSLVERWVKIMKKNSLSPTTIGIALRTFRAVVNVCISRGLISGNTKEMFKDTGYNKVCSRKHEFLDVATMRMLYDFWEKDEAKDKNGKEMFFPKEKHAVFRDLGLFLFMYLGDGQNLADTLRLTYDEWYFATHGKQLRFLRHKTRERNESASEVIFPVTPELQKILDKYGNEPKLGRRVFPIMNPLITPEKEVWVIQRYNRYIREHMAKVADLVGIEQRPTPTWARHSFATNLNNSGVVPYKYISDSMGHSGNGDITSNYIGAYPLEKMLQYNYYLLNETSAESTENRRAALIELLKGMSAEERKTLLEGV